MIRHAFEKFSPASRANRARVFRESFDFDSHTKILDLGSEDGSNVAAVIDGLDLRAENVFIADIDRRALDKGKATFGFTPVFLRDGERLPIGDRYFDIVFCSSVIEHVTVPKQQIWEIRSGREFRERSWKAQAEFAADISRVGRQYFIQTPSRTFPIESHTWLPFAGVLPREVFVPLLSATNRFWPKQSIPDFNLLTPAEMQKLFPDAKIMLEKKFGLTKSIIAIRSDKTEKRELEIG